MALQSSGAISISQIKTELGSSSNSLRTLSAAAGKGTPDAMSEFYGYSSYTPPNYVSGASSISGGGTASNPYVVSWSVQGSSWSQNNYNYYSYLYGLYLEEDTYYCIYYNDDPSWAFYAYFGASGVFTPPLTFNNNTSATQVMKIKFISGNTNLYTGSGAFNAVQVIGGNGVSLNYAKYNNGSGSAWNQVVNTTATTNNFTMAVGNDFYIRSYFNQTYFEAYDYDACIGNQSEYNWAIQANQPAANYQVTLSNYVIHVWFELV